MRLSYEVSTKTSLACNQLFLQQRKCKLDIKENPVGIYSQSYTVKYLKQRNIIHFNTLHLKLPTIIFFAFQLQHKPDQINLPVFLLL